MTSLEHTQDVNLFIIFKIVFMEFFLFFPILRVYQILKSQKKLKTWYFLFFSLWWSGMSRQNRTIRDVLGTFWAGWIVSFYIPWKQKAPGFLTFLEGLKQYKVNVITWILAKSSFATVWLTNFMPLVSLDTPLKISENQRFSDVFTGYRKRPVAWNGLKCTSRS